MIFSTSRVTLLTATLLLTACGGPAEAPSQSENSAENQATEARTETNLSSETQSTQAVDAAVEKEPSPEFASLPAPYMDADYAVGRRIYRQCSSCHMIEPDGQSLVGPNLHGIFDRKVGEAEGFAYSTALQEADFDWTPEQLNDWLTNPRAFLPGNRMSFAGVRRPKDRDAVIAYIMIESGWIAE